MNWLSFCICAIYLANAVHGQGYVPQYLTQHQQQQPLLVTGGTRRQLTPAQQTHILSDIQQHQQRFASQNQLLSPGTKQFGQKISHNILIEPSVQTQLPTETTILQFPRQQTLNNPFIVSSGAPQSQALQGNFRQPNNIRSNDHHPQHHTQTNYVPNFSNQNHVVFPQQPLFERNIHQQQVFQRSVANQQGDGNVNFKPSQPFPAAPPTSILVPNPNIETNNNFGQPPLQPVQTLQQNAHVHTQFNQNPAISSPPFSQFATQQVQFGPHQTHQNVQPSNNIPFFGDLRADDARYKDFVERQKIIQKHEHFLYRQHEKQQAKVRQLHQEFVQKQRRIKEQSIVNSKQQQPTKYFPPQHNSRLVSPYEIGTFERAVQNYHETYPTQPTTTPEPVTENLITSTTTTRAKSSRSNAKGDVSEDELEKLYNQFKQDADKGAKKTKAKPSKGLGRDELLKQLKLALADQPADLGNQNYTTMDLVLPDGQKVQVIRTTDPNLIQGATPLNADGTILSEGASQQTSQTVRADMNVQQTPFIEQFQDSSILPPGSNFEVIRQSSDGDLQPVASLPAERKVTFVYLEEQTDGSYKVQGVKSNGDKEAKTKGSEVDTIVDRIKNGEIQLPPPSVRQNVVSTSTVVESSSPSPSTAYPNIPYESSSPTTQYTSRGTPPPAFQFVSSASPYSTLSTDSNEDQENLSTASPSSHYPSSTTPRALPSRSVYTTRSLSTTYSDNHLSSATHSQPSSAASTISSVHTQPTSTPTDSNFAQNSEFLNILKNNGLHAMAKYLKQSGLDTVLNETGPYTVFAPSDKAFKSLLVQLGGPDRAEEKFKSNPRLLSGLLLHHVIPGLFEIASLQDEMTGVSLAGTQLRVNQYNMHDTEWNDVKITTINGAMILPDKKDIKIPQGVAHSVDRVMFPLPVGDILQTLQSDRERRFTNFLRAIFSSGLTELLQNKDPSSGRTYTVFAPTDLAFANHTQEEVNFMVTDKDTAHKLVMRHLTSGTLFSTGMRFYQVRDSLQAGNAITLQKVNQGKIKVNESQMVTSNIPATNGVIHAIDNLL